VRLERRSEVEVGDDLSIDYRKGPSDEPVTHGIECSGCSQDLRLLEGVGDLTPYSRPSPICSRTEAGSW
jgi:hypothetical protein